MGGQQYDAPRRSPIRSLTNTIETRLSGEDSGRERVAFTWEPANARRPDSHLANESDEPPSISPGATLLSQTAFWPRRRLHAWARLFIPTDPTPQIARSYTFGKDEAIGAGEAGICAVNMARYIGNRVVGMPSGDQWSWWLVIFNSIVKQDILTQQPPSCWAME